MHPRTELKNEIKALITALLPDVNVYASRARELRSSDAEAVVVYVPDETLLRPPGRGENRSKRILSRTMNVEILVIVAKPGDGEAAADRADELARQISLHLNDVAPSLEPGSEKQDFSMGEDARVITSMSYSHTLNDEMEA